MLKKAFWLCFFLAFSVNLANAEQKQAPQRIVSLAPHLSEAVFWLGVGERLSGRDRFSNYPPEIENVPIVGDAYTLNSEALLATRPDLILLWQAPAALKRQIEKLGLAYFDSNPQSLLEIQQELQRLAKTLDVEAPQAFETLASQLQRLQNPKETNKKLLILVQQQPPISLGLGDTLAASLPYCGWENALQMPQAVVNISPEYLATGEFSAVLGFSEGKNRFLPADTPIVRPEIDPLVRPGPRFPAALLELCELLNSV